MNDRELQEAIEETEKRWFTFLTRLEERAKEFAAAAATELDELRKSDTDIYKAAYNRALSGVCGELETILDKARDVREEKIVDFKYELRETINAHHPLSRRLSEFVSVCEEAHQRFEKTLHDLLDALRDAGADDLEREYQAIIDSFNAKKDSFRCSQCGAILPMERLFFIEVHIACESCGAQNNFQPSSQARSLQFIANDIARKRCENLHKEYENEKQKERDIYKRMHELKLSTVGKSDKEKAAIEKERERLEAQRQEAIDNAPKLYVKYLRTFYDELNAILPEFREHHEKRFFEESRASG
jgi:signal transduction histidine kinase